MLTLPRRVDGIAETCTVLSSFPAEVEALHGHCINKSSNNGILAGGWWILYETMIIIFSFSIVSCSPCVGSLAFWCFLGGDFRFSATMLSAFYGYGPMTSTYYFMFCVGNLSKFLLEQTLGIRAALTM